MMDARTTPLDSRSTQLLAQQDLRYDLVDVDNPDIFNAWHEADFRGFHYPRPNASRLAGETERIAYRRLTGVWDGDNPIPIATLSGWDTVLSMPGKRAIDAWAISSVTVSPTHRRRGIARALLEGELRTASAAGAAVAILTATEATIYGRYGFGPATQVARIDVDRKRVKWSGPRPSGRVVFTDNAEALDLALEISAHAATLRPGEITRWRGHVEDALGLVDPDSEKSRRVRVARYEDANGVTTGLLSYRVKRTAPDYGRVELHYLESTTDEAYAALWRFLVEQDFVDSVRAELRSIEEPLPFLLTDSRAVSIGHITDHLWIRVLDVEAALSGRGYTSPERLRIVVSDGLGMAAGSYILDGATSTVTQETAASAGDIETIRLDVADLGSILVGGHRPSVLARAGRIAGDTDAAIAIADRLFVAESTPHLSIWF